MSPARLSFSDRTIAALPLATSGQQIVRDADVAGFFILVGTRSKTFMIQGDLWEDGKRRTLRVKVGDVGQIATREARAKAKVLLGSIAHGVDPRPKPQATGGPKPNGSDPFLREAWERYRDGHMKRKGRSDGTIENYRDHVERLMADWLGMPLSTLGNDPGLVTARHEKLTEEKWLLHRQRLHADVARHLQSCPQNCPRASC